MLPDPSASPGERLARAWAKTIQWQAEDDADSSSSSSRLSFQCRPRTAQCRAPPVNVSAVRDEHVRISRRLTECDPAGSARFKGEIPPLFRRAVPSFEGKTVFIHGRPLPGQAAAAKADRASTTGQNKHHASTDPTVGGRRVHPLPQCPQMLPHCQPASAGQGGVACAWPNTARPYEIQYSTESVVPFLAKNHATQDAAEADIFLIEHSSTCLLHDCFSRNKDLADNALAECGRVVAEAYLIPLILAVQQHPAWACRDGRDHAIVFAHDDGAEYFGPHVASLLRNVQYLSYFAVNKVPRPTNRPNIVIPPTGKTIVPSGLHVSKVFPHLPKDTHVYEDKSTPFFNTSGGAARTGMHPQRAGHATFARLFTFTGNVDPDPTYSFGVRQALMKAYGVTNKDHPGLASTGTGRANDGCRHHLPGAIHLRTQFFATRDEFSAFLASAPFGLCSPGWRAWSPRPFEVMEVGVVPVFPHPNDDTHLLDLPGDSFINWAAASLHLPLEPGKVADFEARLRRISPQSLRVLLHNVPRINAVMQFIPNGPATIDWVLAEISERVECELQCPC